MNILLTAIDAKYIHSNLAVRSIAKYLEAATPYRATIAEYTINHEAGLILRELYRQKPDLIGFSCYIWNFELVKELSLELRKLLPNTVIVWGGPEVSYQSEAYIGRYADHIVCGEGERAFAKLVTAFANGEAVPAALAGAPVDLAEIPFLYEDLETLRHRIVYYESSRGCPFRCQYCLSSIDKRVHFRPLAQTLADLDFFLSQKVPQVKFIDRTFNCDKARAKAVWQHLIAQDNGITNFHFEIAGDLLDEESIALLSQARPHLFQLEIGVQSANPETLAEIRRSCDMERLFKTVRRLREKGNVHLHLDLIAGLPYEDINSFANSFDAVYALGPHQLQLGFLKVLKGSGMAERQAEYGLLHTEKPPYEVMKTNWLSYEDILRLKMVEDMVERYYNSGRYRASVDYLVSLFDTPFAFYDALAAYYQSEKLHLTAISEIDSYTVLYQFRRQLQKGEETELLWRIRYDLFAHQKAKKLPDWLSCNGVTPYLEQIRSFYEAPEHRCYYPQYPEYTDPRQLMRVLHLEVFPFDPRTGEEKRTVLLFQYRDRDVWGNAVVTEITSVFLT